MHVWCAGVLTRRLSIGALATSLAIGACGGAGSSAAALVIPPPEVPALVLAADHGGPTAPASVCIEEAFGNLDVPVDALINALTVLGVKVVPAGCEARLRFEGTAVRAAVRYQPARDCYERWTVDGAVTWEVAGREAGRWPVAAESGPAPQWIEVCTHADAPIDIPPAELGLGPLLVDLFGGPGLAAAAIHHATGAKIGVQPGGFEEAVDASDVFDHDLLPPNPGTLTKAELQAAVARIADALHRATTPDQRDWLAYTVLWLSKQPCCRPQTKTLEPVVPYLIEGLATASPSSTLARHLMTLLRGLTYRSFDTPAAWLAWWRQDH